VTPVGQRARREQQQGDRDGGGRLPAGAPAPQPERSEPRLADPRLRDISLRDWVAIFKRAGKKMLADNMPMLASALAYSAFFAIPAVALVVVGLFTLIAGPSTIGTVMQHFGRVIPAQATQLLDSSLRRLDHRPSESIAIVIVGFVLALWSLTGAMNSYMTAVNLAYGRQDRRGFLKKRATALVLVAAIGIAFLAVAVFLMLGTHTEKWIGDAIGAQSLLGYLWWAAQWPVLICALLAAFATLLWLAPDVHPPRWRFITPGTAVSVLIWLLVSGAFAVYTAKFGSYNKTWGSLSAVIVMLTWLWLTALALLFGAELNAEVERSRELRQGKPAERDLQISARS
jgi:membrane protein